jgi:hypothetical protein
LGVELQYLYGNNIEIIAIDKWRAAAGAAAA